MLINLGSEEVQREPRSGPVPAGSRVLVRITLEKPQYAAADDPFIAESKSGWRALSFRMEVIAGTYEGCWWFERIALPAAHQRIGLTEKQRTACRISGATLRAIVESAAGVSPKDTSPQAERARQLTSWTDLDGKTFPARLGIEERTTGEGRPFWTNKLSTVVPQTSSEWRTLMDGGEIITDGPTGGQGGGNGGGERDAPPSRPQRYGGGYDAPPSAYGSERAGMDDVPF